MLHPICVAGSSLQVSIIKGKGKGSPILGL